MPTAIVNKLNAVLQKAFKGGFTIQLVQNPHLYGVCHKYDNHSYQCKIYDLHTAYPESVARYIVLDKELKYLTIDLFHADKHLWNDQLAALLAHHLVDDARKANNKPLRGIIHEQYFPLLKDAFTKLGYLITGKGDDICFSKITT